MASGTTGSASEPRTLVTHPELKSHQSFPAFSTVGELHKSGLERLLSVFADVRAGEGVGTLLLGLNVFLLLTAYSMLKPARDALILAEVGSLGKAWASGAQAILLMAIVPAYGWLSTRVSRVPLITTTTLIIFANLILFALAGYAGAREGVAFFIWLSIINVFVVSQFWAFANDIYTEGQGRRLFPMIGVGQSLGALVGVSLVPLIASLGYTAYTLMLIAAPIFLATLALTFVVNRQQTRMGGAQAKATDAATLDKKGGFELLLTDRYLFWIGVLVILLNLINTTGGFLFDRLVEMEQVNRFGADATGLEARRAFATSTYGVFGTAVNIVGLGLQLFVASRVMRFMGVRGALFILPVMALVNYSVIAVAPVFAIVRFGKILENSTDYSIQNTVRQALFLPTSREAKYKAKAAIDTFCQRVGDLAAAGSFVLGRTLGMAVAGFAWLNVLLTVASIGVASQIAKEHRKRTV
jgi:AAA family ATP:ADP antiporter